MRAAKAGEIIQPSRSYRYIPLGVLSLASYGLCFLSVALIGVALFRVPQEVLSSFKGEALLIWIGCILCLLALLAINLSMGARLARRRMVIGQGEIIIHKASGTTQNIPIRDVQEITLTHSTAALQTLMKLKYADGRRVSVDTDGFSTYDIQRVALMIAAQKT